MNWGALVTTFSMTALGAAGLAAAAAIVWWLVRKRQKRLWLPTLRVLELENRILPRLLVRPPPWFSFLCFLVVAIAIAVFAWRPREQLFTPFEPDRTHLHLLIDMSPSTAVVLPPAERQTFLTEIWQSLRQQGRLTMSTSHGPEIFEPSTVQELAGIVGREVHRPGAALGDVMQKQLEAIGDVDRLFVVSDRDQSSWNGFNWRFLLDDMDVMFVDLTQAGGSRTGNVFIREGTFVATPDQAAMEWDIDVGQVGADDESFRLTASHAGQILGEWDGAFNGGQSQVTIKARWDEARSDIDQDEPIVWQLTSNVAGDLASDNEFRTLWQGAKQDVLIVSEPAGERVLEDPVHQLRIAFEILGFRVRRMDEIAQPGDIYGGSPLLVLVGGTGRGVDQFCPQAIEQARLGRGPGQQGARDGSASLPRVWLLPVHLAADYEELCLCYSRLLTSTAADKGQRYCKNVQDRDQWIGLLPSLGAIQIGGEVGDATGAMAWRGLDEAAGLDVLAFTVPMTPSLLTGMDHARLPIMVKELLRYQGLWQSGEGGRAGWPRLGDVTALWSTDIVPAQKERWRLSNIPVAESLNIPTREQELPPRWGSQVDLANQELPAKRDREDPLPWLRLLAITVIGASMLEGLALLTWSFLRAVWRKPQGVSLFFGVLFAGALLPSQHARAEIVINMVGYIGNGSFASLAKEVAHRTSLEMTERAQAFGTLDKKALQEPWLWVRQLSNVQGDDGRFLPEVALWLKRGGFLVMTGPIPNQTLAKLSDQLATGLFDQATWRAIPPDHEMMRSFYLLDALPMCAGNVWKGLQFDGRIAAMVVPYDFLASVKDGGTPPACPNAPDRERHVRLFVNLLMVSLATDYKKDQIHLPEILKRLR